MRAIHGRLTGFWRKDKELIMLKLLKARAVRIAARGVRPSDKGAQILASVKSKQILSKQVYNRTNQLDPGDEGSATIPMTVATVGFATNYGPVRK